MYIRDPIYGNVEFDDTALRIIESAEMQRLRYIRQTGFAFLVYPGANHTRFEHSIGTMHATREMEHSVGDDNAEEFMYMGLLHDIGHGPFSHQSEPLFKRYLKKNHEDIGKEVILKSSIRDAIANSSASLKRVMSYFDSRASNIVNSTLGSDRVDYLLRDSHYTGVAYGVIDFQRIKSKIARYRGRPALHSQGISAAESLLMARYFMFENVYGHHAQIIAGEMFNKAAENAILDKELDPAEFARMTDEEAMNALLHIRNSSRLIKRVQERRLFKRVYYGNIKNGAAPSKAEIAGALEKVGIGADEHISLAYNFRLNDAKIPVLGSDGSAIGDLSSVSPLVKMLIETLSKREMLIIATDKKHVEKARAAISRLV